MENNLVSRKKVRLTEYDYSSTGAYFVTFCTAHRSPILWDGVGADIIRPEDISLSPVGKIVEKSIMQIPKIYASVTIEKFCIMPDHVHLILLISDHGATKPSLSIIIGQMKRWTSKQAGRSLWQKSFIDRVIRSEKEYLSIWEYIDNNPLKYSLIENGIL